MIENGPGWVRMKHPETGGEAEATEAAFDEVWQPKGWEIVERYSDPSAPTIESRLSKLTKDELIDRAVARGVASDGTKNDIAAALAASGDTGEDI
jgi:hypothetical protein